jgi:2-polyprenyl-3-methyl-5-hydroxy-6-metoxy-1,4-benzoquinol methylase
MSSVSGTNFGITAGDSEATVLAANSSIAPQKIPGDDALAPILPIMSKYGVTCSPDEFQRRVNVAFHRAESQVYDQIHRCMWESLPQQCQLLVGDLEAETQVTADLTALDIGCGTGLASDLLLNSRLGRHISQIDLLDTSGEMLARAKERSRLWSATANLVHGDLARLDASRKYDVIVVCSVLHHIPDVEEFLARVRTIQVPRGILLHMHDPNGDFFEDPEQKRRISELAAQKRPLPAWLRRLRPKRVLKAVQRRLSGQQADDYILQVNDELLADRTITKAMSPADVWAVTDIHCLDGLGIRIKQLSVCLPDYTLVSKRSYGFFGRLYSELPAAFRDTEQDLIRQKAPNGSYIAGIWRKTVN